MFEINDEPHVHFEIREGDKPVILRIILRSWKRG